MKTKNIIRIVIGTVVILLIPLIAMQFTEQVQWGFFDFIFMGILLLGTGLSFEYISSKGNTLSYRIAVGLAALTGLALIWINAAVGIIGDDNPRNLMYIGVVLLGLIAASISQFKPAKMANALYLTAAAQFLVPIIAIATKNPDMAPDIVRVFVLNSVFVVLWIGSGLLFRHASKRAIK